MRLGAHFATFAILSYTKIIDNSWYSSYLFNHFWLGIQWGANIYGWVAFPVTFTTYRRIITNHQGVQFMNSGVEEYDSLTGFTLNVENNTSTDNDAQWIAIGI